MKGLDDGELAEWVLRSMRHINRRVTSRSRELAAAHQLTVPQLLCLAAIDDGAEPGLTLAGLADAVQLSRSTTSAICERLVRGGLIHRKRDTRDRRRINLRLTPEGVSRLGQARASGLGELKQQITTFDPAQRQRLIEAVETLLDLLGPAAPDAEPTEP